MKRAFAVCAVLATIAVAVSFLREGKPEVRCWMSYDANTKQWQVKGQVCFFRGECVNVLGWSSYLAARTAPFELHLPDERGSLTRQMYEPEAIQAATVAPGHWKPSYLAILAGWLICFFTCLFVWWLFRRRRCAVPEAEPTASTAL